MLVLSRKEKGRIKVGPDIVIEVVEIRKGEVRIGIAAPPGVEISRKYGADPGRREAPAARA